MTLGSDIPSICRSALNTKTTTINLSRLVRNLITSSLFNENIGQQAIDLISQPSHLMYGLGTTAILSSITRVGICGVRRTVTTSTGLPSSPGNGFSLLATPWLIYK